MTHFGVAEALEAQGYKVFLCVGVQADGRIKTAGLHALRTLTGQTYEHLVAGLEEAMRKIYETPLDDLERSDGPGLDDLELG